MKPAYIRVLNVSLLYALHLERQTVENK